MSTNIKELGALVRAGGCKIEDALGKSHTLQLLDVTDLVDFETDNEGQDGFGSLRSTRYILWLMLRREGLPEDAVERREWAYTLDGVGRLFTAFSVLKDKNIVDAVQKVLLASGWVDEVQGEGKVDQPAESPSMSGEQLPSS